MKKNVIKIINLLFLFFSGNIDKKKNVIKIIYLRFLFW